MQDPPAPEHTGTSLAPFKSVWPCRKCGEREVHGAVRVAAHGGHEAIKYECRKCGHILWVDGGDG